MISGPGYEQLRFLPSRAALFRRQSDEDAYRAATFEPPRVFRNQYESQCRERADSGDLAYSCSFLVLLFAGALDRLVHLLDLGAELFDHLEKWRPCRSQLIGHEFRSLDVKASSVTAAHPPAKRLGRSTHMVFSFVRAVTVAAETRGTSSNASTIFIGAWSELLIGMRTNFRLQVLPERYSDNLPLGFLAYIFDSTSRSLMRPVSAV